MAYHLWLFDEYFDEWNSTSSDMRGGRAECDWHINRITLNEVRHDGTILQTCEYLLYFNAVPPRTIVPVMV